MTMAAPPQAPSGSAPIVREIARGGLAGFLTGVVMGGGGGRLAMRLSALLDPAARGARTEGGATVGEFTLAGTASFVIFVGIFSGIALAVVWVVAQRWLPRRSSSRYAVAAILVVAMGARFAIEGRNIDFLILDPKPAQVTIFVALAAATGALVVGSDRWLERRLPAASGSAAWWYRSIALIGALLTIPVVLGLFSSNDCSCVSPPRLPGILLVVTGITTAGSWILRIRGPGVPGWLLRAGGISLALMIVAGLLHLGGEIAHFV